MPLKTWADFERLEAADLNGAFAWSQELTLPGGVSEAIGADSSSIASNSVLEVAFTAAAAGGDPLGIRQSSGRLKVPAGLGGLWQLVATVSANAAAGAGDIVQWNLTLGATRLQVAQTVRNTAQVMATSLVLTRQLVAGTEVFLDATARTSAAVVTQRGWSFLRLGRGMGAPGVVPASYASTLPGPDTGEPADDEEVAS